MAHWGWMPEVAGDMIARRSAAAQKVWIPKEVSAFRSRIDYAATGVKRVSARVGLNSDWLDATSFRRSLKKRARGRWK